MVERPEPDELGRVAEAFGQREVLCAGRRIVHSSVTQSPTALWVVQQLREAFPFDAAARYLKYLLFDRDSIFSAAVVAAVTSMGLEPARTSYQSPWQNGVAERFVGSVRRQLLDHLIVLDDRHLARLLREYLTYYHVDRTHLALAKDTPAGRPSEPRPCPTASVVALRRVGGLHRRYAWQPSGVASSLAHASEGQPHRGGRPRGEFCRRRPFDPRPRPLACIVAALGQTVNGPPIHGDRGFGEAQATKSCWRRKAFSARSCRLVRTRSARSPPVTLRGPGVAREPNNEGPGGRLRLHRAAGAQ